jgi:hypothetical protein
MFRRRELTDGNVFMEQRDVRGELVAETVVPKELEADAKELLRVLAAKWEILTLDRKIRGVLPFRRRLPTLTIPGRSQERLQSSE